MKDLDALCALGTARVLGICMGLGELLGRFGGRSAAAEGAVFGARSARGGLRASPLLLCQKRSRLQSSLPTDRGPKAVDSCAQRLSGATLLARSGPHARQPQAAGSSQSLPNRSGTTGLTTRQRSPARATGYFWVRSRSGLVSWPRPRAGILGHWRGTWPRTRASGKGSVLSLALRRGIHRQGFAHVARPVHSWTGARAICSFV